MVGGQVVFTRRSVCRLGTLVVAAMVMAGCGADAPPADPAVDGPVATSMGQRPSGFHGTLLDPPEARPTQTLRDTRGRAFSLARRPSGEVTVLFFGYTHCPDVCPTTMADLAAARAQLPPRLRDGVTVAFVTEDPARDTPTALRRWLNRFDPSFLGLRGGNAATKAMLTQLHLPQSKRVEDPQQSIKHPSGGRSHHKHRQYGVTHAGVVYAFGPGGRTVIYTGGTTPDQYAADFARLLQARQ
ncbi:MAG: SCO family protein [Pseudonocardiaceae bacterium]